MEKVLVIGANGFTGTEVIRLLVKHEKYRPVAMIRDRKQKEKFDALGVETIIGDLEKDLNHVVQGIDRIIYAAGPENLELVDTIRKGTIHLIQSAKEAAIKKFVLLSSMGVRNSEYLPEFLIPVMKAKADAENYLKINFDNFSIVRPGELTFEDKTNKIKAATQTSLGKISRKDVAQVLVNLLSDDVATNKTFEIIEGETQVMEALRAL